MARGDSAFDTTLAGGQIEASEVAEEGVVVVAVRVNADEVSTEQPVFGTLGSGGRPLVPDATGAAEAICARASDGLPVIAVRDLRIETARQSEPAEGTVYTAGYYGAELRIEVVDEEERSTVTLDDANGSALVLDDQGVRAPTSPLVQGDPGAALDVALAAPLVDFAKNGGPVLIALMNAINTLAPGTFTPQQITDMTTATAAYLTPAAGQVPAAPATRAPDLRGEPGA